MIPPRPFALWLTVVLGTLAHAPAHAQRRKLNAPLATAYLTHVTGFELGAQGRRNREIVLLAAGCRPDFEHHGDHRVPTSCSAIP